MQSHCPYVPRLLQRWSQVSGIPLRTSAVPGQRFLTGYRYQLRKETLRIVPHSAAYDSRSFQQELQAFARPRM